MFAVVLDRAGSVAVRFLFFAWKASTVEGEMVGAYPFLVSLSSQNNGGGLTCRLLMSLTRDSSRGCRLFF